MAVRTHLRLHLRRRGRTGPAMNREFEVTSNEFDAQFAIFLASTALLV